jgi:hypothetical protein
MEAVLAGEVASVEQLEVEHTYASDTRHVVEHD